MEQYENTPNSNSVLKEKEAMRLQCFFVCYRQFQKKVSQNCSDCEDNLKEYKTSVNQLQKKIAEDPLYRINQLILFQSTKL